MKRKQEVSQIDQFDSNPTLTTGNMLDTINSAITATINAQMSNINKRFEVIENKFEGIDNRFTEFADHVDNSVKDKLDKFEDKLYDNYNENDDYICTVANKANTELHDVTSDSLEQGNNTEKK